MDKQQSYKTKTISPLNEDAVLKYQEENKPQPRISKTATTTDANPTPKQQDSTGDTLQVDANSENILTSDIREPFGAGNLFIRILAASFMLVFLIATIQMAKDFLPTLLSAMFFASGAGELSYSIVLIMTGVPSVLFALISYILVKFVSGFNKHRSYTSIEILVSIVIGCGVLVYAKHFIDTNQTIGF